MAARDTTSLLLGLLLLFLTWGAWADEVNMEDRVKVFRGEPAQITCMFTSSEGIGGLIIQWFYVTRSGDKQRIAYQDATMNIVDQGTPFTDRISANVTGATGESVLTIEDVQVQDEREFICLIKAITGWTGEGRTNLKVFQKPDRPTIEAVKTGISVNEEEPSKIATCEVKNGYPMPTIAWYRNNTPLLDGVTVTPSITHQSNGLISVRSELSMKVMKEDKDDEFYCEINYDVPEGSAMTESERISITVYYPSTAVDVWVESPKGKIKEGDSVELHCKGNGNMPSSIFGFSANTPAGELSEDGNMIVLENVTRHNNGVYTCTSTDTDTFEEVTGDITVEVNFLDEAVVRPEDTVVVDQGQELQATCNALSSLQTETVWFKDGQKVSTGHTLMLKDTTFDTAGTYTCVITVTEIEGMVTTGTLKAYVRGSPEIFKPDDTEIEASFESMVDLSCTVRGYPAPNVIWTDSDGKIHKDNQMKMEDKIRSQISIKVTSDITAYCNASNEFGNASETFNIRAIKAETAIPPKKIKKEGNGVVIAVIIICILLLAILGSVLYFLYKKGKICGRSGKQDLTKEKSSKDNIVVEMKSDNTEEAVLLGVNGEKQPPNDQ
ncbi:melanoma cell adhesion molecule b isoform X2 [Centropristis striata]|uniref:melanoma cell adhesion molecule b isoform X2 n=1 Tax=Centropristis striata TaxID=184440 RepID=UPI0027E0B776|nr:melanoma cell adhesion molecule b isoform X2 [Centropristis striata]